MAGYLLQPKVYKLVFEEHPGLEMLARSVSVEELIRVLRLADAMTEAPSEEDVTELFGWFAQRLIGWNIEVPGPGDDDPPVKVPATLDGLLGLEFDFALTAVMAWVNAVTPGKSAPSGTNGTPPADPVEGSIPMTSPSDSTPGT